VDELKQKVQDFIDKKQVKNATSRQD